MSADEPMDADVNLLVSSWPRAPGRSRREIVARLRALGDAAPLVSPTERRGIMTVRTSLDPRDAIRRLRALHHDAPAAFRCTTRWLPVDVWTAPGTESLQRAVAGLRDRIRPGERWRMSIERRTSACPPPAELIAALAPLVDNEVDLSHPDKVVRIEVFSDHAAVSVLTPEETFSVGGRAAYPTNAGRGHDPRAGESRQSDWVLTMLEASRRRRSIAAEAFRATLAGLAGVHVQVEPINADAERDGLTRDVLEADVESALREAGIAAYTQTTLIAHVPGTPVLHVDVMTMHLDGRYAYSVRLELWQAVTLVRVRGVTALALTWSAPQVVGTVAAESIAELRDTVRSEVAAFVEECRVATADAGRPGERATP